MFGPGVNHVSSAATFAVGTIYGLSGAALLLTTRPGLGLFGKPTQYTSGRVPPLLNAGELTLHRMEGSMDSEDIGRLPSRSSV